MKEKKEKKEKQKERKKEKNDEEKKKKGNKGEKENCALGKTRRGGQRGLFERVSRSSGDSWRVFAGAGNLVTDRSQRHTASAVAKQALAGVPTDFYNSVGVGEWLKLVSRLCDNRECSGEPRDLCESLELSKVRIGLETTELQRTKCTSIPVSWG